MAIDKGEMIIKLTEQPSGLFAITVAGKRRGHPMGGDKLAKKVQEWQTVWAARFGYSSTKIIIEKGV